MAGGLPPAQAPGDDRGELLEFVQALRATLEWHEASGTTGLPRDPDAKKRVAQTPVEAADEPTQVPVVATATRSDVPTFLHEEPAPVRARPGSQPRGAAATAPAALPVLRVAEGASLESLRADVAACKTCGLCERRTQTVFSRGTGRSGLCFVGEGPGADEDREGAPFVGAAGQLLDRMIAAMGIDRDDVYVANIVKCRPPDNRKPLPEEMAACVPYLHRQLELVAPSVIVALGATALEGLLGKTGGITRHRGRFSLYRGKIAVMPTFHPAYLLRQPSAKRDVWSDLQEVLRHMGRPVKGAP